MDSQYLQRQRFQLQKRMRKLNSCSKLFFHSSLIQFWGFLNESPLFGGVLQKLRAEAPALEQEVDSVMNGTTFRLHETESEALHFALRLIEQCVALPLEANRNVAMPEVQIGIMLLRHADGEDELDQFRETYLEPIYEYLDDALDRQVAALSLLIKYRQRVEWFRRSETGALGAKGERALVVDLYAYLHDQGLDFSIEPRGPSGIPDLVSKELVLDAKLFDADARGKTYIAHGVHQVHTYLVEFSQIAGYLVIYRTCPEKLHFSFATPDSLVPFLHVGGKVIYFLVIDICDYEASASKRGTMKEYLIDDAFVIRAATEPTDVVPTSP